MKENIKLDRIVNSILQRRKKFDNFILVEGSQDRLFFLKFKAEKSQIEITFGWEKLIEIINKLKQNGFDNVIGIIDRDQRDIIPENLKFEEEIIITDDHDINILSIQNSFETIFKSYCSDTKVDNFVQQKKCLCIKEYTHELTKPLSFLKLINKREKLNLSFKSNDSKKNLLDYSKFVDKNKYEIISITKMVETITNFSRSKTTEKIIPNNQIVEKLEKTMQAENFDFNILNNGHDFGEIICLGLKKVLGSQDIESEDFLKDCILNYESKDFVATTMYSAIKLIEKKKKSNFLRI